MNMLLSVAIALFAGLMMTRVFRKCNLKCPDVTCFLIAGLLVGPYALGRLHIEGLGFPTMEDVGKVSILSDVALGFIAFDIGNEFRLSHLKETGRTATVIGIIQAVVAALLVDAALIALYFILGPEKLPLPVAITLGAIASATAPAATLMVVRQYKAKGPVTDLLLPIVALDDAVGLMVFAVSFGIAQALKGGELNVISIIVNPLLEILIALSSLHFSFGDLKISFSSLLVCMMLGTMFCNLSQFSPDIMSRTEKWTSPLYAVFFVLSGAQLELGVFRYPSIILIGVVYILMRCIGKYAGAFGSAAMMGCSSTVRKYLGITLFPQAGVALGMVVTAQSLGESEGAMIRNIILFSVMIYELAGPMLTRIALTAAGEITPVEPEKQTRERFAHK